VAKTRGVGVNTGCKKRGEKEPMLITPLSDEEEKERPPKRWITKTKKKKEKKGKGGHCARVTVAGELVGIWRKTIKTKTTKKKTKKDKKLGRKNGTCNPNSQCAARRTRVKRESSEKHIT